MLSAKEGGPQRQAAGGQRARPAARGRKARSRSSLLCRGVLARARAVLRCRRPCVVLQTFLTSSRFADDAALRSCKALPRFARRARMH